MWTTGGRPVGQTWVPLGASPSFADDETVIAALREAVQWRLAGASPPRLNTAAPEEPDTDLRNSRYRPENPDHSTTYTPTN
ncbi:hypothetical protein [Amycolatopsis kentuckyensis]|uniref:hypothetical protein n=1 Tax=Amycolatopsis kentuckyensis TaxID=218823 RepID=UPI003566E8BF